MSGLGPTVADVAEIDGASGPTEIGRGSTWRDGVLLSRQEKAELSSEQLQQYLDDSVVHDLSEIEQMPEPTRSWARGVVERARARVQAQIAEQEHSQTS
jgi:hypothetical protein